MLAFLLCAVFGAVLLAAQLVAGLGDGDAGHGHAAVGGHGDGADQTHDTSVPALALLGVRPLAAGVAFFGLAGAAARTHGLGPVAALAAALAGGGAAAVATALLLRTLLRFESDGTVHLDRAVGAEATVYVPIAAGGTGKVQLALQGRLVECSATSADGASYATGAQVLVVDRAPNGSLLVAADPAAPARRGAPDPFPRRVLP